MRHFGIIGFPLQQSFSAKYFNEKFETSGIDAEYSLYPLKELTSERVNELMNTLDGMNVTLPHKQAVMPYLDGLDETAEAIGAVNVIYKRVGYNTDCLGFLESIRPLVRDYDKKALVLGTGGASKAPIIVLLFPPKNSYCLYREQYCFSSSITPEALFPRSY
ncbi:MAG: hypothetical protein IKD12_01990 [Paludibacteraceae bacterium]|nr:hypothetical protein [Paludibacteraceae bacterium]